MQEGFKPGQKGSSAMPHKRNPISAETISGLARVLRSNLLAGLQDVALWHERDISHSSVERVVLPDSSQLAHYVMRRLTRCWPASSCSPTGCAKPRRQPRAGVQPAGAAGAGRRRPVRDDAYRIVQRNAMRAWDERVDFRSLLEADPEVTVDRSTRRSTCHGRCGISIRSSINSITLLRT